MTPKPNVSDVLVTVLSDLGRATAREVAEKASEAGSLQFGVTSKEAAQVLRMDPRASVVRSPGTNREPCVYEAREPEAQHD